MQIGLIMVLFDTIATVYAEPIKIMDLKPPREPIVIRKRGVFVPEKQSHAASKSSVEEELAIRRAIRHEGREIKQNGITVITRENCGFSAAILGNLNSRGIDYTHILAKDIDDPESVLETMRRYERKFPAVYLDGVYIGGYTESMQDDTFIDRLTSMNY